MRAWGASEHTHGGLHAYGGYAWACAYWVGLIWHITSYARVQRVAMAHVQGSAHALKQYMGKEVQ